MAKYKPQRNYDLFGVFSWYTPGVGGLLLFAVVFLAGLFLAVLTGSLLKILGLDIDSQNLITYIVMFVPVLIYAGVVSREKALWDKGWLLDSNKHFGVYGGIVTAVIAALAMFCLGLVVDPVNTLISKAIPMSDLMKQALESIVGGNFVLNFLSVCIFAPIFEEWMCRGIVLRSLLQKARPVWAIIISALVFALIHANIWQGFNAFALGLLLGYVYYKTGSLKLTILMHFTNNFVSLLASQSSTLSSYESWGEIMPGWAYWTAVIAAAAILAGCIKVFKDIPLASPKGNCDEISSIELQ